ncbi:MAG: hypothetical protein R3E12_03345 [Candidatus Eisenbacteria bacterium]
MKKLHSAGLLTALCAVGLALSGASCPLIPSIEEKVIELALGGSTTVPFEARGIINDKGQTECFDLADELDLNQILEDADVDSVTGIALARRRLSRHEGRSRSESDDLEHYGHHLPGRRCPGRAADHELQRHRGERVRLQDRTAGPAGRRAHQRDVG